jgi:hypothetical protein
MFPRVVRNTTSDVPDDEMSMEGGDESIFGVSISLDGESVQLPGEASLHETREVRGAKPTVRRVDLILGGGGIVQNRGQLPRYDSSLADEDMSSIENSVYGDGTQASTRDFRGVPSLLGGDGISLYGESTIQDGTIYYDDDDMSLGINSINTSVYYDRGGHGGKNSRAGRNSAKAVAPVETSITLGDEEEEDELNKAAAMEGSACCKPWIKRALVLATIILVVAVVMISKGAGSSSSAGSGLSGSTTATQGSSVSSAPTSAPGSKNSQSTKKPTKAPKQQGGDRQRRVSSSSGRRFIRKSISKLQQ